MRLAALLCAALAAAGGAVPPRGWTVGHASLLLYDSRGELAREIGLGRFSQELGEGLVLRHVMSGGASPDGRFAWHWHKDDTVRVAREDTLISSTSTLVYMGTSGQTLWQSSSADAPRDLDPLLQSKDGETVLLVERSTRVWSVSGISFTGDVLCELRGLGRLEKLYLSANGKYALVLWGNVDEPLFYSFLAVETGERKDVPAADVPSGVERIEEDGSVLYRKKILLKLP